VGEHREVFISATTRDLGSYRAAIQNALLTLNIFPIQQDSFALAYGQLADMLRNLIGRCDAVIHLAGFYYGAEPPRRPPEEPRRSYTQIEYDVARKLGKPIYLFLATKDSETDKTLLQTDEEKSLQIAHRQAIQTSGEIYYPFASSQEVASQVLKLRFPERDAEAPRRVSNLPYNSLGPLFKGRDDALAQLRQRVQSSPRQSIHGMSGVGKTRLAIEYAWRHASDYEVALLFASASTPVNLLTSLTGFCNPLVLDLPQQVRPEQEVRLAAVFHWLNEHSSWLLILDNADAPEAAAAVEQMLPRLNGGHVLITSRFAYWSPAVQTAEPLDVLDETEAAAFLLERTESQRKKMLSDSEDAAAVARDLGGLALALQQGAAYVLKIGLSFSEYRSRWETIREKVLAWYDERLIQYPGSVATALQASVDQLTQPERKLLNILAWFAPERIPVSLLDGEPMDGTDSRDALGGLASWNLARWTAEGDAFTIHRLTQEITRQRLSDNERDDTLGLAVGLLDRVLPSPEWDQKGWRLWERLAPHCRILLRYLRDHPLKPKATRMMGALAVWLRNRAEHGEAEPLLRQVLAIQEQDLGPEHPDVAQSLTNLAELYERKGQYAETEPLYKRALAILEKAHGPEHPDLSKTLNSFARSYRVQSRFADAEPLYGRALAIREKVFPNRPELAQSLYGLAALYGAQGRYVEAESLYERALATWETTLGPEHPDVAETLNKLAGLYRAQCQYAKSEALYKRSLAISEKTLGPEHPYLATSLNNLALLLSETNRLAEAEPLYRRALAIDEKSFGPQHPNVARDLTNLAGLLSDTNRLAEAEPPYRRALAISEKSFGPEHPDVAIRLTNLAELLRATNRPAEAEPLSRRHLRIFAEFVHLTGHEHPHFRTAIDNYADLLSSMGLSEDAVAARVRSAIEGEPPTITSISPATIRRGASPAPLQSITGSNFVNGCKVRVNNAERPITSFSPDTVTINLLPADIASATTLKIVVVNPNGKTSEEITVTVQ
jgi:tetratricopeptide (TPR) repeat protein